MKRFLSVLLTAVMLLSMVTVSYASEEKITVEYINANTTEIIIELSKEVPNLQDYISLRKNGTEVSGVEVTKKDPTPEPAHKAHGFVKKSSTEYLSVRNLTANTNPTYVIAPADGLEFGAKYALLISGEALCGDGYRADIVVNNIFADEFNYTSSTSPWKPNSGGSVSYSNKTMTLSPSTAMYLGNNSNTFADKDVTLNTWLNDNSTGGYKIRDRINLEIMANFADTSVKHNVGLGLSRTVALSTGTGKAISMTVGGDANGKKHTGLFVYQGNTGGDPKYTDYPEGTTPTANYASATNVPSKLSGYYSYVSYPHEYAMTLDSSTSFKNNEAQNVSMYYDGVEDKVIYSGAGDYYNYSYDMPDFDVRARATVFNYGSSSVTLSNFRASYPTIEESVVKAYSFDGPTYWNAAYDTIILDFDAPLSTTAIRNKIEIHNGPETDPVSIESITRFNDVTREANFTDKHTYKIKLETPFEDEGVYTLVLRKGGYLDEDGAPATMANDYTVTFRMDLFVLEKFGYKEGANAVYSGKACVSNFPWAIFSTGKYGVASVEKDGNDFYLKVDNTGSSSETTGRTWLAPNIPTSSAGGYFANTGISGSDYSQKDNAMRKTSDYTMEADVRVVQEGSSGYQIRMYQSKERMNLSKVPHNELTVTKSANGDVTIGTYAYGANGSYVRDHMANTNEDLAGDDYVRLSMAIKGEDHKWTVGNSLVHEVVEPDMVTAQEIGIPVFDIDDNKVNNIYYIDNLFLTKAIELDAMECSDIVINDDATVNTLPSSNPIKVSATLTNKGGAKNFVALLVVRNTANESTVRVYDLSSSIQSNASAPIEFSNVNASGGDRIELYVWSDLSGITAYTGEKVFPKN